MISINNHEIVLDTQERLESLNSFGVGVPDGSVIEGTTSDIVRMVHHFEEVARLGKRRYLELRDPAWAWKIKYPLHNEVWKGGTGDSERAIQNCIFYDQAQETLRNTLQPAAVRAGSVDPTESPDQPLSLAWFFDTASQVLKIAHQSPEVEISDR